jgi:PAB-dependent poly(A)-specific ribonuclease subunit 3
LQFQQEDLIHFGQLVLALACGSLGALQDLPKALDFIDTHYSKEIKEIVLYLLSKPHAQKNIDDIARMLTPRIFQELDFALR